VVKEILGLKDQRQISALTAAKRGSLITVVGEDSVNWTMHSSGKESKLVLSKGRSLAFIR